MASAGPKFSEFFINMANYHRFKNNKNFNKSIFFSITLILGGILFIAIIEKVGIENIFKTILTFHLWNFMVIAALNITVMTLATLRWKIILDASENRISFNKIFIARMIGSSINYLTPSGLVLGEPFKAMVLSGKTGLSLGSAMTSIIIEGSIFLSIFLMFIIIGIFALLSYSDLSLRIFTIIAGALVFFLALFYLFFTKMIKPSATRGEKGFFTYLIDLFHLNKLPYVNSLKNKIIRRENEIKDFFKLHRKTVFAAIFLSILEILASLSAYWMTLHFLGLNVKLNAILGLFSLMSVSYLIPLPGSLGGLELSQIFAFSFFNLGGQSMALAFTLITRLVSLFFVAIGIILFIQFELDIISSKIADFSAKLKQKIRGFLQSL